MASSLPAGISLTREEILSALEPYIEIYSQLGQSHVFDNFRTLDDARLHHLHSAVTSFSLPYLSHTYNTLTANITHDHEDFAPYNDGGLDVSALFDISAYADSLPCAGNPIDSDSQINPGLLSIDPLTYTPQSASSNFVAPPTHSDVLFYYHTAMANIIENKIGVVILAGGQGTRLGFEKPKAVFPIDTPSQCTLLLRLLHSRFLILKLAQNYLTHYFLPRNPSSKLTIKTIAIPLIILTSGATDLCIREYIDELHKRCENPLDDDLTKEMLDDIFFIQQSSLPSVERDTGKIVVSDDYIQMSPNGNGGVYAALFPLLDGFRAQYAQSIASSAELSQIIPQRVYNLTHLMFFNIDNICGKVCDPVSLGYTIYTKTQVAVKCVPKVDPSEKVGVLGLKNGKYSIVEYSEIKDRATERDEATGKLKFIDGNTNTIFFSTDFLYQHRRELCQAVNAKISCFPPKSPNTGLDSVNMGNSIPLHRADKTMWVFPNNIANQRHDEQGKTQKNVIKFELFGFDSFPLATSLKVLRVNRHNHFLPVKNQNNINPDIIITDSPADAIRKSDQTTVTSLIHHGYIIRDTLGRIIVDRCQIPDNNPFIVKNEKYVEAHGSSVYHSCLGFDFEENFLENTNNSSQTVCLCEAKFGAGIEFNIAQFYALTFSSMNRPAVGTEISLSEDNAIIIDHNGLITQLPISSNKKPEASL